MVGTIGKSFFTKSMSNIMPWTEDFFYSPLILIFTVVYENIMTKHYNKQSLNHLIQLYKEF